MSIFRSTQSDKKGASIEAPGTLDTSIPSEGLVYWWDRE